MGPKKSHQKQKDNKTKNILYRKEKGYQNLLKDQIQKTWSIK